MKAQQIYDLREVTGYVSGQELQELFNDHLGTYTPSGNDECNDFPLPTEARMPVKDYFAEPQNLEFLLRSLPSGTQKQLAFLIDALGDRTVIEVATAFREISEAGAKETPKNIPTFAVIANLNNEYAIEASGLTKDDAIALCHQRTAETRGGEFRVVSAATAQGLSGEIGSVAFVAISASGKEYTCWGR